MRVATRRIVCRACGASTQEAISFCSDSYVRYTQWAARFALVLRADMSIKAVAEHTGMHWETVKNIEPFIKLYFAGKDPHNLEEKFPKVSFGEGNIEIGEGAKLYPGAYIAGNVLIGKNCEIRPGASIRENVILGDNCIVGNSCELKNSILLNNALTSHFNYLGDSIVGNNTNIAASTIFANIRFDYFEENRKNIGIKYENAYYDTGLVKFGGVLGDGSQTGCKALINPCTFIGKKCILGGFKSYRGIIKDNTKIIDHLKD